MQMGPVIFHEECELMNENKELLELDTAAEQQGYK